MRILIDLQGAQSTGSAGRGIGRYTRSFCEAILALRSEYWEFHFLINASFVETANDLSLTFGQRFGFERVHIWWPVESSRSSDASSAHRRLITEALRGVHVERIDPDVVLLTSLFEGFDDDAIIGIDSTRRSFLQVAILYDAIPFIFPDLYLKDSSFSKWYMDRVRVARELDLGLAISESTRTDFVSKIGCVESAIVTIGGSAEPVEVSADQIYKRRSEVLTRLKIADNFVLYTGGNEKRKNLPFLVKTFAAYKEEMLSGLQLVVVCKIDDESINRILQSSGFDELPSWLKFTDFIVDSDLQVLYSACSLFIFPSTYEGLGLPILEAARYDVPIICARGSSLSEVVDLPSATFDPYDIDDCLHLIGKALHNESFRVQLVANNLQIRKRNSWDLVGSRAVAAIEAAHKRSDYAPESVRKPCDRRKNTLAYVTPLSPLQTGVALYSHEVIPSLARYFDVTIVSSQEGIDDTSSMIRARLLSNSDFEQRHRRFDFTLYNIGNSHFHWEHLRILQHRPGMVILHDPFLSDVVRHQLLDMNHAISLFCVYDEGHGIHRAITEYTKLMRNRPIDPTITLSAIALIPATHVIVHSEYARKLLTSQFGHGIGQKISVINFPTQLSELPDRDVARKALHVHDDEVLVCSFGFVAHTKASDDIVDGWIRAARQIRARIRLVFVGRCADKHLEYEICEKARRANLQDQFTITGFVDRRTYLRYLSACDVAIQLRRRGRGESSMSVTECLSAGVPTIINANGSFVEFPTSVVRQLTDRCRSSDIAEALVNLVHDDAARIDLGKRAKEYADEHHSPSVYADRMSVIADSTNASGAYWLNQALARINHFNRTEINQFERIVIPKAVTLNFPINDGIAHLFFDISSRRGSLQHSIKNAFNSTSLMMFAREQCVSETVFDVIDLSAANLCVDARSATFLYTEVEVPSVLLQRQLTNRDVLVLFPTSSINDEAFARLQHFAWRGGRIIIPMVDDTLSEARSNIAVFQKVLAVCSSLSGRVIVRQSDREALMDILDSTELRSSTTIYIDSRSDIDSVSDMISAMVAPQPTTSAISSWRPDRRRYFPAIDPRLLSGTGVRMGWSVVADGRPGRLIYGPYISIERGSYEATIDSLIENHSGIKADVVAFDQNGDELVLSESIPNSLDGQILMTFETEDNLSRVEVRMEVSGESRVAIHGVALRKCD